MADFYRLKYSTSHLFFPKIVITILAVLAVCILIQYLVKKIRAGEPILPRRFRFFAEGYDKLKFYGTFVLLVAYIPAMKEFGFLWASIVFIFLFNALFCGTLKPRSLAASAVISIVFSVGVWYLFGVLFRITLP